MRKWFSLAIIIVMIILYVIRVLKTRFILTDITGVEKSIKKLLETEPENLGFIIICGDKKTKFIQFSRENFGLMLFWPNVKQKEKEIELVKQKLMSYGYLENKEQSVNRESILNLKQKEFLQDNTGLYANSGNNVSEIKELVRKLFKEIYNYDDFEKMKVQLVLKNR